MNYTDQIKKFLEKTSDKRKIIVIYGPTGAGKTAMSIEIAKTLDTQIISTDSRQIYRGMDIGTGKITEDEMQGIPHHMIDIIDPDEKYSVGAFKRQAEAIIQSLWEENKIPMLVGGTGLYIDSLIFDMNLGSTPNDERLREEFLKQSTEELYKKLEKIDPEYARELHPNNRPYIERGIEVKLTTGKSKLEFREEKELRYDVLFLTPELPEDLHPLSLVEEKEFKIELGKIYRQWLYERINTRVEQMFESGLEQEVRELIREGYIEEDEGMKAIGYQEFFPYFREEIKRDECMKLIQQHSRNYAKRQLNWFSKYEKYRGN